MTMKNLHKTKLPHLTKGLIGNYHYGLNIEHAKPVLEKGLILNSLLRDIPTATKQAAGREGVPAGFIVHVSKSNLNNLERALKYLSLQLGFKYMTYKCKSKSSFSGYILNDYEEL